eukprot:CAMPEP_0202884722 /NCGR_PEP_ID=MMETSP1391-20130828/41296_1 /ASSEMBLY_ACC=CAM_ASM_000867 /TAXON_ID=1034604 /ORGANISM="Chlamydomonas leiostraca, Strain SAG 11-49" /LENGTH=899 /DNA_ID=CAMNT_0049567949 /DNA_START=158 /DNA_END=2857 /DNA_ORIENTATION=+
MNIVQQGLGVTIPLVQQVQQAPPAQPVPLALQAMLQQPQQGLAQQHPLTGGGRPPDMPSPAPAIQTNTIQCSPAAAVPLVQQAFGQYNYSPLSQPDDEPLVSKRMANVVVPPAPNFSPGAFIPHGLHGTVTHAAPVPLAQAAMQKALQEAATPAVVQFTAATTTTPIEPAPALAQPAAPAQTLAADAELNAAAKRLLSMFSDNMDIDFNICKDVLHTFSGDVDAAAEHLLSMFDCTKDIGPRWDEPVAAHFSSSPPVVSLLHSILPDAHLHSLSAEPSHMDADAALAAKLQKEEEDAAQQLQQAGSDGSSTDAVPDELALLLSPTDYFHALNPSSTITAPAAALAPAAPEHENAEHLQALLPDDVLAAGLMAEDQLFAQLSHEQCIKALCRDLAPRLCTFFPDVSVEEAQHVLEAYEGNMEEAQEALWRNAEEEANRKLAQAHADEEYARKLHEQEGRTSGDGGAPPGIGEQEMADLAASDLAPRKLLATDLAPAQLLMRSRNNLEAIERQHQAFAQLPRDRSSSPGHSNSSGSSGQWEEVQSEQVTRCVDKLQHMFGSAVDRSLLTDVLNTCNGSVEAARQELSKMGITEVAPMPPRTGTSTPPHPRTSPMHPSMGSAGLTYKTPQRPSYGAVSSKSWLADNMVAPGGAGSSTGSGVRAAAATRPGAGGLSSTTLRDMEAAAERKRLAREAEQAQDDGTISDDTDSGDEAAEDAALEHWYEHEFERVLREGSQIDRNDMHRLTQLVRDKLTAKPDQLFRRSRRLAAAAEQAFQGGDRALAFQLSQRRRECFERAKQLSERNAQRMFDWRNASTVNTSQVDLHGLSLRQAMDFLERQLGNCKEMPGWKHVTVITGQGLHSQEGGPVLLPNVRTWLQQGGYSFKESLGAFQVTIPPERRA